jgi:flavin-binding protein dodecin
LAVVKVLELVGSSDKSWSDAARQAVEGASQTLRGITGVDVVSSTAKVTDGKISEYHVTVKIAFEVERADG